MKFAKELDRELVPEWRIKYLNYKAGKKYVKGLARAIQRARGTPILSRSGNLLPRNATFNFGSPSTPWRWNTKALSPHDSEETDPLRTSPAPVGRGKAPAAKPPTQAVSIRGERNGLAGSSRNGAQYGSFPSTLPSHTSPTAAESHDEFRLPGPAIRTPLNVTVPPSSIGRTPQRSASAAIVTLDNYSPMPPSANTAGSGWLGRPAGALHRLFSASNGTPPVRTQTGDGSAMQSLDVVRQRERQFFEFLDSELEKVDSFFRMKENQAGQRLQVLEDQLREMRDRRVNEMEDVRAVKKNESALVRRPSEQKRAPAHRSSEQQPSDDGAHGWLGPVKTRLFKPGPNSKALQKMPHAPQTATNDQRDYVRRPHDQDVSYRTAKRKLKLALQEFYRSLELLKAYALLNRTAFRKISKKYDKAVNARPPYRYMKEKVDKAWFVNSDVLEGHIKTVEDLYSQYFEHGNRKVAVGKLRELTRRPGDESASAFRNGLMMGTGLLLSIQGLISAVRLLSDDSPVVREQTSYLLQVYGGYFLMLYLFMLFCFDCRIWSMNKVNYPFIFEFSPRSHLDWRQLSQFPSFFFLLFGIFLCLNFQWPGSSAVYLYYPVILVSITVALLFFPAPTLWHQSRSWFLYSHVRSPPSFRQPALLTSICSGASCSLGYTLSSSATSFSETCTAL